MKKMDDRGQRSIVLLVFIVGMILLISGCNHELALEQSYVPKLLDLPLSEGEVVLDILEAGEDYRVLVGMPDGNPEHIYLPTDELGRGDDYIYYSYPTEFRTYDQHLNEKEEKREVTVEGDVRHALLVNGYRYTYARSDFEHVGEDPTLPIIAGKYDLYRDGDLIAPIGARVGVGSAISSVADEETVYTLIKDGDFTSLYVNDNKVILPNYHGADDWKTTVEGLVKLKDTVYLVLYQGKYEDNGSKVTTIDSRGILVELTEDTKNVETEGKIVNGVSRGVYAAMGDNLYFTNKTAVYATDGKTVTYLCDVGVCGFSEKDCIKRLLPCGDGRIFLVIGNCLVECAGQNAEETESVKKQEIILGLYAVKANQYSSTEDELLHRYVAAFNQQSERYAVTMKSFDNITQLNLALTTGEVALVVSGDQFAMRHYAANGVLIPLEEAVSELLEDGVLLPNLVDAVEMKGRHYFLPHRFEIRGCLLPESVMQGRSGFVSTAEFIDFMEEEVPKGLMAASKSRTFAYFLENMDEWIDWDTNTARFTDGNYQRLLEFCNENCSKSVDEAEAVAGANASSQNAKLLLGLRINATTGEFSIGEYLTDEESGERKGDVFFPLPGDYKNGYPIETPWLIGVADRKETTDAAADFMRYLFTSGERAAYMYDGGQYYKKIDGEYLISESFPVNQEEFEDYITCYRDLILELTAEGDDYSYLLHRLEEDIAFVREAVSRADHLRFSEGELYDVMMEETTRCFSGQITAKQAAEYIQNRVQLYLDEQG